MDLFFGLVVLFFLPFYYLKFFFIFKNLKIFFILITLFSFFFLSFFLFFLPFLLSCVADRVLVLWLGGRPEPQQWKS